MNRGTGVSLASKQPAIAGLTFCFIYGRHCSNLFLKGKDGLELRDIVGSVHVIERGLERDWGGWWGGARKWKAINTLPGRLLFCPI